MYYLHITSLWQNIKLKIHAFFKYLTKKSNSDKEMRARMEDRENSLINLSLIRGSGYKKGKEEGRKEGIKEGKENLIKTMLSNGATKETILKLTALSEDEFNKIINS